MSCLCPRVLPQPCPPLTHRVTGSEFKAQLSQLQIANKELQIVIAGTREEASGAGVSSIQTQQEFEESIAKSMVRAKSLSAAFDLTLLACCLLAGYSLSGE